MSCRNCNGVLVEVLRLGNVPIVSFKDRTDEKDDFSPLTLCKCRVCNLVQLDTTVAPERLFSESHYLSGINQSMNDALFDVVKDVEKYAQLKPGDIAVDIGANDGTLLSYYRSYVWRIGFEPARNVSPMSRAINGPEDWVNDYFSTEKYFHPNWDPRNERKKKAKVVTAIAMFYDVADPNTFLKDVVSILSDDGIFVVQMNDLDSMCQNISVDNICHEHLTYYSMDTLLPLLRRNGLYPINVSYNSVNGGSIRVIANKTPNDKPFLSYKNNPVNRQNTISDMWDIFLKEKSRLLKYITNAKKKDETVWAYGASTRGTTLLHLLGLTSKDIVAVVDKNPKKVGKRMAGSHIPIVSEEHFRGLTFFPHNLLVLPYYFEDEFLNRELDYLKKGGKMLFPLPKFRVWTFGRQKIVDDDMKV